MKQIAQQLFRQTLAAIDIPAAIRGKFVRSGSRITVGPSTEDEFSLDLREFDRILAIVFGKAAFAMAEGFSAVLSPDFSPEGILVCPAAPPLQLPGWTAFTAGHPLPDAASLAAGRMILDRLSKCDERTLVFFLISGGGSSLVEQPLDPSITLGDVRQLYSALVTCGAPIEEMNAIRKHLSATKGGRSAAAAPHSMKVTLAISDVPQDQESALASGPTLPDPTTIQDAATIAKKYSLIEKLPPSLRSIFETHSMRETPKSGDPAFANSKFVLLLGEGDLLEEAHRACRSAGYLCIRDDSTDNWPLEKAADHLLAQLQLQRTEHPGKPVAVIAGGELISPVTASGIGGRNSAFVLTCAPKIAGQSIVVLSAGTDGMDGNSPAAGAVADGGTLARSRAAQLDPADFLRRNDAYTFFAGLGDAIVTGPTGNNLRDLRILLAW